MPKRHPDEAKTNGPPKSKGAAQIGAGYRRPIMSRSLGMRAARGPDPPDGGAHSRKGGSGQGDLLLPCLVETVMATGYDHTQDTASQR